jgi:hypothetical protein
MAELSSLVFVRTDALGRPTGLVAAASGDVIASSIITPDIIDPTQVVIQNSSVWEAAPVPLSSYQWNNATTEVNQTSAIWNQTNADVAAASAGWNTHTGASAPGFEVWNQTNTDVAAASAGWNSGGILSGITSPQDRTVITYQSSTGSWVASGPVEVSSLAPAPKTGALWLDTNTNVSGVDRLNSREATTSTSVTPADFVVLCDATSGDLSATLDTAANMVNKLVHIKKVDSTTNSVIVVAQGGETIDGETSQEFTTQWTSLAVYCTGTSFYIL